MLPGLVAGIKMFYVEWNVLDLTISEIRSEFFRDW
jgi:hypothetical protein